MILVVMNSLNLVNNSFCFRTAPPLVNLRLLAGFILWGFELNRFLLLFFLVSIFRSLSVAVCFAAAALNLYIESISFKANAIDRQKSDVFFLLRSNILAARKNNRTFLACGEQSLSIMFGRLKKLNIEPIDRSVKPRNFKTQCF